MNRGVSLMAQYQYEAAAESFQEALRLQPRSQEARLNLAIALFNRNRKEDVADSGRLIDEVLRQEPKHARALYFKAIMLQHVGRAQDAIPLLQQVLEQHPRDGVIWYLLGLCKQRTGQDSEVELLKAVEFRPYLYSAYYQLYQSALRAGKQKEPPGFAPALKHCGKAPWVNPSSFRSTTKWENWHWPHRPPAPSFERLVPAVTPWVHHGFCTRPTLRRSHPPRP